MAVSAVPLGMNAETFAIGLLIFFTAYLLMRMLTHRHEEKKKDR